jgi:hypothetical protein
MLRHGPGQLATATPTDRLALWVDRSPRPGHVESHTEIGWSDAADRREITADYLGGVHDYAARCLIVAGGASERLITSVA